MDVPHGQPESSHAERKSGQGLTGPDYYTRLGTSWTSCNVSGDWSTTPYLIKLVNQAIFSGRRLALDNGST